MQPYMQGENCLKGITISSLGGSVGGVHGSQTSRGGFL